MNELLKARLDVLSIEMETVTLLGHTSDNDSPRQFAAREREIELRHEISRLHLSLTQGKPTPYGVSYLPE